MQTCLIKRARGGSKKDAINGEILAGWQGSELKKGLMSAYALYVTTNRILGRKEHRDVLLEEGRGLAVELARREMDKHNEALKAEKEKSLTSELMKKYLTQDLETKKLEIKAIQLRRSRQFEYGYIKSQLRSGSEIEIKILLEAELRPRIFEKISDLLRAFYPEVLKPED
jgi:hypothetical protein